LRRESRSLIEALVNLSAGNELPWSERLHALVRVDSEMLDVARVSYWRLLEGGTAIQCEALFRADSGSIESGLTLRAQDYPSYFGALAAGAVIAAEDARQDPRTREFSTSYLAPAGIGAMMDVPVYVRGALAGVVCHEHVGGARAWTLDEQQFAISIGQMLSLSVESGDRRRAEDALRRSEARFRAIAQVSPVPLVVTNRTEGKCLWGNQALGDLLGLALEDIPGKPTSLFYATQEDRAELLTELDANGCIEGREVHMKRADGALFWARMSIRPFPLDGESAMLVALTDLTERKMLEEHLRHVAMHDALTGLPNRAMLFDLLRRELARAKRDQSYRFAVLYLDLDDFKPVNDELGHDVGDRLLAGVAERLQRALRPMDAAARVGGDEFAVLVANVRDEAEPAQIAARIATVLAEPLDLGTVTRPVATSIGAALGDARTPSVDALLRQADLAMYEVKTARKIPRLAKPAGSDER
jgi:diguanylate cyclase (GGDEF)-like protein/PAS domain S-box-containing protein